MLRAERARAAAFVQQSTANVGTLGHIDLSLEIDNLAKLFGARRRLRLLVDHRRGYGLGPQRRFARVRHEADAARPGDYMLEICGDARTPINGDGRISARESVDRARV